MNPKAVTFHDLLNQKQWHDYASFVSEAPAHYQKELSQDIAREKQIREALRKEILEKKYTLRRYEDRLSEAERLLFD